MADYTWGSVVGMYALMVAFAGGAVLFLARAIRSGAVGADEAPKYRMLEDEPAAIAEGSSRRKA